MSKKRFKRLIAGVVSAAAIAGCTVGMNTGSISAEGDENYAEALAMSLYFFDSNECGGEVKANPLTWRGNCHLYDSFAEISKAENFPSQYASVIDPDGDGYVDVSGGYHDAGDHIKFNLTIGFAGSSLAMSYYLNPGAYKKADCEGHLCDILKKIADYMMKTTFLDGSGNVAAICYNVSDESDHSHWTSPEVQDHDRKTYWMSSGNNNTSICGEMASALAGASYVLKRADKDYAEKCLKYAKAIYEFGCAHEGNETAGMGSMYGTETGMDELALAQAWLYLNGESSLPEWKANDDGSYSNGGKKDYNCWYYCWNKVWSGYAAMMYKITGDESFANEMEGEIKRQNGLVEGTYNTNGWGTSRYNCAQQMLGLQIAKGDKEHKYAKASKYQMNHILGNNSTGYSFLVGYGDKWPVHIHHRAANCESDVSQNPSAKYTNYGMLVGGDDASGYQDQSDKYQYTEPALDYNACFALACAGLVNLYGGDPSALQPIIAAAPEIDENHQFGKWYGGVLAPDETETPTEQPTEQPTEPPTEQPIESPSNYDLNRDGVLDGSDVTCLSMFLTKQYERDVMYAWLQEPTPSGEYEVVVELLNIGNWRLRIEDLENFDVNKDGNINVYDTIALKRCISSFNGNGPQMSYGY